MSARPDLAHPGAAAEVRLILVHSPIVGPDTWAPVAEVLRAAACHVLVPRLDDTWIGPFWPAHVASVVRAVGDAEAGPSPLVLVLHSGAGQLADHLVAALDAAGHTVEGVVFADAGLPPDGASRLAQLGGEDPEVARELDALLTAGERVPDGTDEQLAALVPDGARRRRLLDGIRTLPAEYWRETIPPVDTPPHRRAAVLLGDGYAPTAATAMVEGWPILDLRAHNHFLALREPEVVAEALLDVIDQVLGSTS